MNAANVLWPARRWRAARRVVAVRLDNMGDVLMATPALAAVHDSLPGVQLTLLASPSGAALAPHLPMVDEVMSFDAPWVKCGADADPADAPRRTAALIERMAERRFDAAIIFTTCTQSALPAAMACHLAGIPLRLAHCRENPYGLLSDWVPETDVLADGMRHEVERQLALVAAVGMTPRDDGLVFRLLPRDAQLLKARLAALGVDIERPFVVVHAGATAPSRRYPAARFGAAAETIARETGCMVMFTGDAREAALIAEARAAMSVPSLSLAGELSLGELAVLIDRARVLVSNNTGPAHMAAALGTPVVDLYALTNPQHTPWRVPARVLNRDVPCRHCQKSVCPQGHQLCLRGVEAPEVAAAALELMRLEHGAAGGASSTAPPLQAGVIATA
jgi:lipopolysaccharide heptosyltransferase II